ncbi:hypothetical protein OH76DRAFT_1402286 [Lentinus brumalis]|uniref:Fungal-type protein kinase domain-containing protein n=1 Tax=Lentinus brumalis TaxID=2498619 RepID=A0A371DDS4_9APHY|nr:hypothetical protein OH76DRAFT_1402286 [Polyporus brumalis]
MANSTVGLRDEFIDKVLKIPDDVDLKQWRRPRIAKNPFLKLEKAGDLSEGEISDEMTRVINTYGLAPGLSAVLCENAPDSLTVDNLGQKVDSALYTRELAPTDSKPHWADQLLPIEYKRHQTRGDPFDDTKPGVEADAKDRKEVRGQVISYAELIFAVQQRLHLIMILVMGRKFRLLFWDRSGVGVSLSIDYYEHWQLFCEVLWRISVLARFHPELLGVDPSATRIFPNDPRWTEMSNVGVKCTDDADHKTRELAPGELVGDKPITYAYVRKLFRASLEKTWPRYQLEVPDGENVRKFLVGRPYFRAKGMTGRGTRGYVAWDCHAKKFVWLKDAWRAHYALLTKEGDILAQLNAAEVSNVPTLVCHGDIRGQTTKTPEFWEMMHPLDPFPLIPTTSTSSQGPSSSSAGTKRKWTDPKAEVPSSKPKGLNDGGDSDYRQDCPLRRHIHYRIVVEEVCLTLPLFEDGQQLVSIIYDCALAHYEATQKGIIHRDVSGGNILILPCIVTIEDGRRFIQWTGILTDWELAKGLSDPRKPRQPERTGTWQYMSVALLNRPQKAVEIPDDMESLFYVLLYHAVRYLKSNCKSVPEWLEDFFDVFSYVDGGYGCGHMKQNAIETGKLILNKATKTRLMFNSPMDQLLGSLLRSFQAYYLVKEYDETQQKAEAKSQLQATSLGASALGASRLRPQPAVPTFEVDDQVLAQLDSSPSPEPEESAPTEQQRKLANIVSNPKLFVLSLRKYAMMEWAADDKEGDRVPIDWLSTKPVGPTYVPGNTSNKRQRRLDMLSLPAVMNAPESPTTRRSSRPRKAKSTLPQM